MVGEGSAPGTPMGSSFGGSGADEDYDIDEDSNTVDDDDEYKVEAMESMPERIPKIKRYITDLYSINKGHLCHSLEI